MQLSAICLVINQVEDLARTWDIIVVCIFFYCIFLSFVSHRTTICNFAIYVGNDGLSLDANTLYYCSGAGASPTVSKKCSFTCVTMPSGSDDKCSTSGTCANVNTGYYCGNDKINGDSNTLYLCKNSNPAGAKYCSSGCHVASSGSDDYCN